MARTWVLGGQTGLLDSTAKWPARAAVLAVLVEQPGHGWDVARRASRRLGSLWSIDLKHVYDHLGRLEAEGLVRLQQEPFRAPAYHLAHGRSWQHRDV